MFSILFLSDRRKLEQTVPMIHKNQYIIKVEYKDKNRY